MKKAIITVLAAIVVLGTAITAAVIYVPKSLNKAEISSTVSTVEAASSSDTTTRSAVSSSVVSEAKTASSSAASSNASSSTASKKDSSTSSKSSNNTSSKSVTSKKTSNTTSTTSRAATSSQVKPEPAPEPVVMPELKSEERYDYDGTLLAETDTLNGAKAVALTFDDGPGKYTAELLEGLRARDVRATFFMVGSCVDTYPELLPIMVQDGHQLGNHTYSHPSITALDENGWRKEIEITDNAIYNACGHYSTAFRPPYGSYTEYQARSIDKTVTLWSVDTLDWQSRNKESIKKIAFREIKDGSIVLFHDLYKTSVDAALEIIDELKSEGYVFVTVDQLLTRYGYPISNTGHFDQKAVGDVRFTDSVDTDTESYISDDTDSDDSDKETYTDTDIYTETDTDTDPTDDPDDDQTTDEDTYYDPYDSDEEIVGEAKGPIDP